MGKIRAVEYANVILVDMFRDNKFVLTMSVDTICHGWLHLEFWFPV